MSDEHAQRRRRSSRLIDRVTDALGHEATFGVVVVAGVAVIAALVLTGSTATGVLSATSLVLSLATLVMICAVQHTSSRESKALNLKLDELIRISPARNDLIGAEDESHRQLTSRAADLRERHRAGDHR
ncbi:MAG TPA: low affinity iron permease family protein [Gaiellales bacterium]|jgi:low affinity Fe/Cu permease